MRWFGKAKEQTDIFRLVRVNDRIQVELDGKTHLSRIEDIQGDELHVAAPVERGGSPTVRSGQDITVNLFEGMGIKQFYGTVIRVETSRVAIVVVGDLKFVGTIQRREHVRISQKVPVRFRLEEGPDGRAPWFEGATQDISGGGMQIVADSRGIDAIVKGDLLEIELYLPDQSPVKAVGQIVRASSSNPLTATTVRFGVQFVDIGAGERSRIVRYVLRRQADTLSSRREFTACRERVAIQYRGISEGASSGLHSTFTREMSATGLKMALEKGDLAAVGEKLSLYVSLPDMQTVEAEAEIVWMEEGMAGAGEVIGLRFTTIDRQSQQMISQFLTKQTQAKAA